MPPPGMEETVDGRKIICDGLVCSIAQALSRKADVSDIVSAVAREYDNEEITNSWKNYFGVFKDVMCKDRKKPIIDIARTEMRLCISDIVNHLNSFEKEDDLSFLVMPWMTKINPLENDGEIVARTIVEANSGHVEQKIDAMEKRIDMKNKAFFESLQCEMRTLIAGINSSASNPSFASVAARAMGPPPPPGPSQDRGRTGRDLDHARVQGFSRDRSSSASKRARVDDEADIHRQGHAHARGGGGLYAGVQVDGGRDRLSNRSQSRSKKYVVGTLSTNQRQDRKMKSPPADIFIYGVHPDTTEEDIINDLKESDINIEARDIVKKSKPEAALNSYKISVKAEDLQRALDPSIWPLRVKVREYIYYGRRTPRNQGQGQQDQGLVGAAGGQRQVDGQHRHRAADQNVWNGVPTYSRFDAFNSAGGSSDQP